MSIPRKNGEKPCAQTTLCPPSGSQSERNGRHVKVEEVSCMGSPFHSSCVVRVVEPNLLKLQLRNLSDWIIGSCLLSRA